MFRSRRKMGREAIAVRAGRGLTAALVLSLGCATAAPRCRAQEAADQAADQAPQAADQAPQGADAKQPNPFHEPQDDHRPPPVPPFKLEKTLPTVPVPIDRPAYNYQMVNASLLPRDKKGIWVLDFRFKPLRIITVDVPGKGRRQIHYLYYRVANHTGEPRMFVPQFVMVNEKGQKFGDDVVPEAVPLIRAREDQSIPVQGAVDVIGMLPPSKKPNIDDSVYGVACWENWDPKADRFSIYVRGLSDGYKEVPVANGGKPVARYKSLRIDFIRRGDEHDLTEREIQFADPSHEWVYW